MRRLGARVQVLRPRRPPARRPSSARCRTARACRATRPRRGERLELHRRLALVGDLGAQPAQRGHGVEQAARARGERRRGAARGTAPRPAPSARDPRPGSGAGSPPSTPPATRTPSATAPRSRARRPAARTGAQVAGALEAGAGRRPAARRPRRCRRCRSRCRRRSRRRPARSRRARPGTRPGARGGAAPPRSSTPVGALERVLGRQVLGVQVVGHHLGLDREQALEVLDPLAERAQRLAVLQVADVVATARPAAPLARQNVLFSSAPQASTAAARRAAGRGWPGTYPRERRIISGGRRGRRAHHRVVGADVDRAVVGRGSRSAMPPGARAASSSP